MKTLTAMPEHIHEGRNVKRIREILGVKQESLAADLGISQQAISQLEQREALDPQVLEQIAKSLKVPVEAIKSYKDESTLNIISNTYNDNSASHDSSASVNYNFNPIDKIVQLYNEKVELYERMLKSEKEKVEMLERLLKEKK